MQLSCLDLASTFICMRTWIRRGVLTATPDHLTNNYIRYKMLSGGIKGNGVDWKAAAEMLSSKSTACQSQDGETDNHKDAEAVEVILKTFTEDLRSPVDLPKPARQEAMKKFDAINLKYDLEEMKVAKANCLSFSTSGPAPPPPYRGSLRNRNRQRSSRMLRVR